MDVKNKAIAKNTFFLVVRTIISLLITLYTTRIVLKELGVEDYGVFSLVYGVVMLFTFINTSMNESVQRYFAVHYGRGEYKDLGAFFKSSIYLYFFIALFFFIFMLSLRHYVIFDFLNIANEKKDIASNIYIVAVIGILFSVMQTPSNSLVLAAERMSFYAYVSIFESILKLLASIGITLIAHEKLFYYSILLLISSIIIFLTYSIFVFVKFKNIIFLGNADRNKAKELFYFSFWNVLGNFSTVLRIQGVNIIINLFFSTTANAAYAVSNSINGALNSLSTSLNIAIKPQIYKAYATGDMDRYFQLIIHGSKLTFLFLFLLCMPIFINLHGILTFWLINPPVYTYLLTFIVLLVSLIDSLSFPLMAALQATGRIKTYQLIVSSITILSIPVIYLLFNFGFSLYILGVVLIASSILTLCIRVHLLDLLTSVKKKTLYLKAIIPCFLGAAISSLLILSCHRFFLDDGIFHIIISSICVDIITISIFYILIFNRKEKMMINNFVSKIFRKLLRNN